MLHVMVDGLVYGFQKFGGINSYFNSIIPHLARTPGVEVSLLTPRNMVGEAPRWGAARIRRSSLCCKSGLSWKLDRHLSNGCEIANKALTTVRAWSNRDCVYHSTYFSTVYGVVPQVATVYDMNHELFPNRFDQEDKEFGSWLRRRYREYVAAADRVIAISNKTRDDVVKYYGVDDRKIRVIHLAVDRNEFYHSGDLERSGAGLSGEELDRPFLLYVGNRNTVYKNFLPMLSAFAASRFRRDGLLVVAGTPWTLEEREKIDRLKLGQSVRLVLNPPLGALRTLYSSARGFIYPSLHEGFGIPLLEAMACETAVLAADTAVFREVAGNAALFFNPNDVEEMAIAIDRILDDDVRAALIYEGRSQLNRYSWERCARETLEVYLDARR